jgi:hypothetical protein
MNERKRGVRQRFKGITKNLRGNKYQSHIKINGLHVQFPSATEVESALMYNYAANLIQGEYAELNVIPDDEMPTYERQWQLYDMVVAKLRLKGFPCADALKRDDLDLCA